MYKYKGGRGDLGDGWLTMQQYKVGNGVSISCHRELSWWRKVIFSLLISITHHLFQSLLLVMGLL